MSCHQTEEYNENMQEKTNDKLIELLTTHQRCEELLELACYQFCRNRKELLTYTEKDEVKEYASNERMIAENKSLSQTQLF